MSNQLPGRIWRESEFTGDGHNGKCGSNALAAACSWADQRYISTQSVYVGMLARRLCAVSGASTIWALWQYALACGYRCDYLPYSEPCPGYAAFRAKHAGAQALVTELANGQALRDSVTGLGENATNLHYHFICDVGGGWFCDGDNWAVGDVLQHYPDAVLNAAQPCAALAIYGRVAIQPMAWTRDANGRAHDDRGHSVGQGIAEAIFAHGYQTSDGLTGETAYDGAKTFCALENGVVVSWDGASVHTDQAGLVLAKVWNDLQAAQARPPAVVTQPDPVAAKWLAIGQMVKSGLGEL